MRFFAESCSDLRIGQQPADQLSWFHIISLLTKIPNPAAREWYATHAVNEGCSRPTLDSHIKSQLATAALKDPYVFKALRHRQTHRHRRTPTCPPPVTLRDTAAPRTLARLHPKC